MNFNIISAEYTEIETLPVMPSKGHITRDIDPSTIPFISMIFIQLIVGILKKQFLLMNHT